MLGGESFTITPRRGELIVFDKLARPLLSSILLPVPTARTKGVLVAPTVYGNVLLGPTARGRRGPGRHRHHRGRAGRAAGRGPAVSCPDWWPRKSRRPMSACARPLSTGTTRSGWTQQLRYACAGGIRSTGLSASLGIAEYVAAELWRGRAAAGQPGDRRAARHAVPRPGRAAAVPGRGPDRRRPGVRPHRLPLRAGQPGRDPRRAGQHAAPGRPGRAAPPHPRLQRALPGFLLRGHGVGTADGRLPNPPPPPATSPEPARPAGSAP